MRFGALIAGGALVEQLLPMDEAIAAMRETLGMPARGGAGMPPQRWFERSKLAEWTPACAI